MVTGRPCVQTPVSFILDLEIRLHHKMCVALVLTYCNVLAAKLSTGPGGAGSSARAGHRDINFRACSGKSSRLYQYKAGLCASVTLRIKKLVLTVFKP
eukprot:2689522-Amphidinium_carterae.2